MSDQRRIFVAMMRAAARGQGLNLTFDEVRQLAAYELIERFAVSELTLREHKAVHDAIDYDDPEPWLSAWRNAPVRIKP